MAELSADDVGALKEAAGVLEQLAADTVEENWTRAQSLAALDRIHEALNDWGRPGLVDWYLGVLARTDNGEVQGRLLRGGEAAAKGSLYHLGGVHQFWAKVDAMLADSGKELTAQAERMRKRFNEVVDRFEKTRRGPPVGRPLALTVKKWNMAALLKPIEEPKSEKPKK